jgi:hypothetical protein
MRQYWRWARFGGKAASGCLQQGSLSTSLDPYYRSPVAAQGSGSPNRFRLQDLLLARRRGGCQGTQFHWGKSSQVSMLGTSRHKIATHNPIAFANCTKPLSDRTPGELRPDMITCFFHKKAVMSAGGLLNQWGKKFTLRGSPSPLNVLSIREPPARLGLT